MVVAGLPNRPFAAWLGQILCRLRAEPPNRAKLAADSGIERRQLCKRPANRSRPDRWRASSSWRRAPRTIEQRYLERCATRAGKPIRPLGVDEIYLGKAQKFLTVVSNLETDEPQRFGRGSKEDLGQVLPTRVERDATGRITAACVEMWEPFTIKYRQMFHLIFQRKRSGIKQIDI